jgi:hypothetical protein
MSTNTTQGQLDTLDRFVVPDADTTGKRVFRYDAARSDGHDDTDILEELRNRARSGQPSFIPASEFGKWNRITHDTSPTVPYSKTLAQVGHDIIPSGLALGLSLAAGPEAGYGFKLGARALPAWLARAGASLAGGAGGELGVQGLAGENLDPRAAASRGVAETAASLGGDLFNLGGRQFAEGTYRGVLRPGAKLADQAAENEARLLGKPVQYHEADLARQALRDRVPIGPGIGGTGAQRIKALNAPSNDLLTQALTDADKAGVDFQIGDVLDGIPDLRKELLKETDGKKKVAALDRLTSDMRSQFYTPGANGTFGKVQRISPQELQDLKGTWQKQLESYYKSQSPDERQALTMRFTDALAKSARSKLEAIGTPNVLTGTTLGDDIARANAELSRRKALGTAVDNVEAGLAGGTRGTGAPWWTHAGTPAMGAGAGFALGHGPEGAAIGTGAGLMLDRLLSHPVSASRLSLALTDPAVQRMVQQSPHAAYALFRLMQGGGAPSDQSRAGMAGGGFVEDKPAATPHHENYLTWSPEKLRAEVDALKGRTDFTSRAMLHAYSKRLREVSR